MRREEDLLRLATLGPPAEPLAAALRADEVLVAAFLGATGPVALTSSRLLFSHKGELWTPGLNDLAGARLVRRGCEFSLHSGTSWRYRGLEDPAAVVALLNAASRGLEGCDGRLFAACYGATVDDDERVLAVEYDGTLRLMLTTARLLHDNVSSPLASLSGADAAAAVARLEHAEAWASLIRHVSKGARPL